VWIQCECHLSFRQVHTMVLVWTLFGFDVNPCSFAADLMLHVPANRFDADVMKDLTRFEK
jgi:hypothetical protein